MCYLVQILMSVSVAIEVAVSRAASIFKAHMSVHVCKVTSQGVMASIAMVKLIIKIVQESSIIHDIVHLILSILLNTDIDECQNSPCEHNCTNTVGSFVCSCPAKYTLASDGLTCDGKTYPCVW